MLNEYEVAELDRLWRDLDAHCRRCAACLLDEPCILASGICIQIDDLELAALAESVGA